MKKVASLLLCGAMALSLTACGGGSSETTAAAGETTVAGETTTEGWFRTRFRPQRYGLHL